MGQAACDKVKEEQGEWYYEFINAQFQVFYSIQPNCWPYDAYVTALGANVQKLCCTSGGAWRQC